MRLATLQSGKESILYDAGILWDAAGPPQTPTFGDEAHSLPWSWFAPAFWHARGAVLGQAPGRGTSLFVDAAGVVPGAGQWVLRGYRRGGLVARLSTSRYVWPGRERSRAFREMRLTAQLHEWGLPVPTPVAAWVRRFGISYEAALLTARLQGAVPLAELLDGNDAALFRRTGATIRRFHEAGLDHVDLNARNLLVTPDEHVWLIDLDRCRLRRPGRWRRANLNRLTRSLERFSPGEGAAKAALILQGYR